MTNINGNHLDAELLALEAKLVDEYAAMEAKRGKTDDEVNEWTARLDILERQFVDMPAHTLNGVAAKLRQAEEWTGTDCTGDWGEQLVKTALAGLEQIIGARGQTEADAKLLRLNTEYRTLLGEIAASKHSDGNGNLSAEALGRREDLERKIAGTPASTFAGFAIKLRIAANGLQPEYPRALETDEINLKSALADAERLAGGVV